MSKLGFIGLGSMGSLMASRLMAAGASDLAVFDVRTEAVKELVANGAIECESPAAVANRAEVVFLSLPTPDVVSLVVTGPDGVLEGTAVTTVVESLDDRADSDWRRRGAVRERRGLRYLDSPVSGGPNGARNGTLTVMASGDAALFEELKPSLEVLGSNVVHVGSEPGFGQLTKLINNLLSATAMAITSEAVALGVKGGLDPAVLLEVINTSSGRNTASMDKLPRCVLPRTFDFGFGLRLMQKDVGLCLQEATNRKVPMILSSTVNQLWSTAAAELPADADVTSIAQMIERWMGVTIGSSPE